MRLPQSFLRPTRKFSLWNGLRARVLQTPLFGTAASHPSPPKIAHEQKMSGPLNGEIAMEFPVSPLQTKSRSLTEAQCLDNLLHFSQIVP